MIDAEHAHPSEGYSVKITPESQFILSTSGSMSSIEKHNTALQSLNVNAVYFTFARDITSEEYAHLLKSPIVRGGAVTGQGLKSGIIPFLHTIDPLAKETGAVNTVVNEHGTLIGYNTDAFGLDAALRKAIRESNLNIQTAVIYGNGGVSGVAAYVLKQLGIRVTMTGRNQERAQSKMQSLNLQAFSGPYDLVVSATPASSEPLINAPGLIQALAGCQAAFDHNMPEKDGRPNYLQAYCTEHNVLFIPGRDMYIPQMIMQWQLLLNGMTNREGKNISVTEEDIKKHWAMV